MSQQLLEFLKASPVAFVVGLLVSYALCKKLASIYRDQSKAYESERNDYRSKLHSEKEQHNATSLENQRLKTLPNLATLETLLKDQTKIMESIDGAFREHSECDTRMFEKILEQFTLLNERAKRK